MNFQLSSNYYIGPGFQQILDTSVKKNVKLNFARPTHSPGKTARDNAQRTKLIIGEVADRCMLAGMMTSNAMLSMVQRPFEVFSEYINSQGLEVTHNKRHDGR